MQVTRRRLLASTLATATSLAPALSSRAQDATPHAGAFATPDTVENDRPGFGIARVRTHQSPEMAQAVYPDVMSRFLPPTAMVEGYFGYIFAFDNADARSTINITLVDDEAAGEDVNTVAKSYVEGMDPRLAPETTVSEEGAVRIYQLTDRPLSELPPLLHGCHISMRHRLNAPETDIEGVIRSASEGFGPIQAAMDSFVMYCWMHAEGGRISFNVWETEEQMEAGNKAVADWGAANPVITTEGETVVHSGVIGYSDLLLRV